MPVPLIVIGGVILFFLLLLSVRIRVSIVLKDRVCLTLYLLCFKIRIFPREKKVRWRRFSQKKADELAAKKAKKEALKAAKKAAKRAKKEKEKHLFAEGKKEKATLLEKIILVRGLAAALIRKTNKKLRLVAARLHIRVATGDAAKTAVLYGAVCGALAHLLAGLDRVTKLEAAEPDVSVTADYLSEKSAADVQLDFMVRVFGATVILISVALAYLRTKQQLKIRKKQKQKAAARAERDKNAQKGTRHG